MEKQTEENCFERVDERPARPADQVLTVGSGGGGAGSKKPVLYARPGTGTCQSGGGHRRGRSSSSFRTSWQMNLLWDIARGCEVEERIGEEKDKEGEPEERGKGGGCLRIGEWLNFMGVDRPHLLHEARQVINEGRNKPNEEVETSQLILGRLSSSQL